MDLNHGKRHGTVRDDEGRECHEDERSVTMGHDDPKMVTRRYWDGNGNGTKS
jgi:hypothetical protein